MIGVCHSTARGAVIFQLELRFSHLVASSLGSWMRRSCRVGTCMAVDAIHPIFGRSRVHFKT